MGPRRVYYQLKPLIPQVWRLAMRRRLVTRQRKANRDCWPIDPNSAKPPVGWTGWPDGKKFALVLTHDVETALGLSRCRDLLQLEKEKGFRSAFYFVPERYDLPSDLRNELKGEGFEVGVHGLKHDGKLYNSRKIFAARAREINGYLKKWDAEGFRSPLMHHNLGWLHDLDVTYDASTFDTDPFEPQPDGAHTIFPFMVKHRSDRPPYVELPYTLVQDSTLFIFLKEKNPEVWKRKLEWVAEQGGMALLITHPDYMYFGDGSGGAMEYPASFYEEFLDYVTTRYEGQFWSALPREVAKFWSGTMADAPSTAKSGKRVWIDLDNSPHVPFFRPIIRELEARGHEVYLTARDAYQVYELADHFGLRYKKVGRHYGKRKILKVLGTAWRVLQLLPDAIGRKPDLALSHGSRSQILLSRLLGIPSVLIGDYEHSQHLPLMGPNCTIVPDVIPDSSVHGARSHVRKYPGIKEDVYAPDFRPDPSIMDDLGLRPDRVIVTVRPPATEAHYHRPESDVLFHASMEYLMAAEKATVVLLPRSGRQAEEIRATWPQWFVDGKTTIPNHAVDGLNLLWHSDLVISGGGTMNREAAALGVPVYSIFRGTIGAVDHHLEKTGRLVLIESTDDIQSKIQLVKRSIPEGDAHRSGRSLDAILGHIEELIWNG